MRLHALGRPRIVDGNHEVPLQPLPLTLLVYLTVDGPRERTHLAELFWSQNSNALNSLSSSLNRIRSVVPGAIWTRGATQVGSNLESDVRDLQAAADSDDLSQVASLYEAPFLGGLTLRRYSLEFEEWMLDWRSSLASTVELALLRHGHELLNSGRHIEAANAAERAWEIATRDGFPSPDLFAAYHQMLALAGNRTANTVRAAATEFGLELGTIEPVALTIPADLPPLNLPNTRTRGLPPVAGAVLPIYGCHDEQQRIIDSLAVERVTTIVGLGGSGKTRLADQYFESDVSQEQFAHAHWVNLRDVRDPDLLAPAIAATIGVRFAEGQSLTAQLPDDEPTLIVLDNFEHLTARADAVSELVEDNAAVRVLVTSRTPLEVPNESLVRLTGLDCTGGDEPPAEQLFTSAARRAGAQASWLGDAERPAVLEVCERLGGHPLALELAGAWTLLLQPSEILDALKRGTDMLDASDSADARSMAQVLDESWSILNAADRESLMLLSTYVAGCATAEIVKMPELSITSIRRLVERSMVSLQAEGRVELHPLIANYAMTQLQADGELETKLNGLRSRWCQQHLQTLTETITVGATHAEALAVEYPNIAAAWAWDTKRRLWDLHQIAIGPLREFLSESGRVSEGNALLHPTITALKADPDRPPGLLAEVLEAVAWLEVLGGRTPRARELLAEALDVCPATSKTTRAQIMRTLGLMDFAAGETATALTNFEQALSLLSGVSTSPLAGKLRHDLGQAQLFEGDRDGARDSFRAALDIGRAADDPLMMARSYLTLGHVETPDRPSRAVVLLEEGLTIAEKHELDHIGSYFPYALGLAHLELEDAARAERFFGEGMQASANVGHPMQVCANHIGRAKARLASGAVTAAAEDLQTATRLAIDTDCWPYMMWAAIVAARVAADAGHANELGLELLTLAWHHQSTHKETQVEGTLAMAEIYNTTPESCPDAPADGAVRLDEIAELILEVLKPVGASV